MKAAESCRSELYEYVKKKYQCKPDYPWKSSPEHAVFRHADNKKWYGLIVDIPRSRLGLSGEARVDVLNVKVKDAFFADVLVQREGYFPGYHMNHRNWISVLLDGTVPFEEICGMLDDSYLATASKQRKQKARPPKEWLIPANPKYYDIVHAFDDADIIEWKQSGAMKAGDTVYLYVGAPVSAIMYKCRVTEADIPYSYQDENLTIQTAMKLKLLKRYEPERLAFETLKKEYGIFAVRGPRGIPNTLSAALRRSIE